MIVMVAGGYFGRALVVDAGDAAASSLPLSDEVLRAYIGGAGLGAWLMHRLGPPGVDPLAAEAPLAFVFSPLVGTPLTTSAKFAVVAKSAADRHAERRARRPATSRSPASSPATTRSWCAAPARELSVLLVDGDGTRLADAADLCGLPAAEAERRLRERLGRGWRVAAIGPAGERGVRYATISHDGRHAGRGGLGAVMGAKRLKAVAVRAGGQGRPGRPGRPCCAAARDLRARSFGPATAKYRELGTLANLLAFNAISTLPTRNFQAAHVRRGAAAGRRGTGGDAHASPATAAPPARSAASTSTRPAAASRRGWSTRTCSRSARCAGCPTPMPCSPPAAGVTSSGWTPSRPAAPSPGPWSAPSGA